MSKAEELARQVIHEWEDYALGGARVHEVVSELRRLAQVEAEHAALLKAISDAEPVAWMHVCGKKPEFSEVSLQKQSRLKHLGYKVTPLYTLNGVKKP